MTKLATTLRASLIGLLLCSFTSIGSTLALAAAPDNLPYQGQLWSSAGQTLTGTYDFRFSLWDLNTGGDASVAVGGNLLWKEEYIGTAVNRSIYEVVLGSSGNPLPDISTGGIYLQVEVKNDGTYETLKDGSGNLPTLAAVPFALNANKVGGRAATEFGLLSAAESVSGVWNFVSGFQIGGVAVTATAAQLNQLVNVVASSTGVTDAGKLVRLDANGKLDNSLFNSLVSLLGAAIESAEITDDTILDADINAAAAIAGTKISPDFGSQDIVTTGGLTVSGNVAIGADSPTAQKSIDINGGYGSPNGGVTIQSDGTIKTDGNLVLTGSINVAGIDFYTGHGQIADTFKVGVGAAGADTDYLMIGTNGEISDNGGAVTINDADGLTVSQGAVTLPNDSIESAEITDATIVDADINAAAAISPNKIATDASNRFVTDAEKTSWDTKQASSTKLTALDGLTWAADRLPYFTSASTATVTALTAFGRSLLDDTDAAAARTTLGLGSLVTKDTVADADITNVSVSKLISAVGAYFTYKPNNVACANNELLRWDNTNGRWYCSQTNIIENRTSDPGAPVTGQMWLRTDL